MYLLYVDESGDSSSKYFVAAGVLVHEQAASVCGFRRALDIATVRGGGHVRV